MDIILYLKYANLMIKLVYYEKTSFPKGLEKSNEKLKETDLGIYNQSKKEIGLHRDNHKKGKKDNSLLSNRWFV